MSKFEVTLKQLRENKFCVDGYNKLICSLKGVAYIEEDSYIRLKHDVPISLIYMLESSGLCDALWCLKCNAEWDKPARLLAVAYARQVQHLMTDKRSLDALDVAERFANGLASKRELEAAINDADNAAMFANILAVTVANDSTLDAANDAARASARASAWAEWYAARSAISDSASDVAKVTVFSAAWAAISASNSVFIDDDIWDSARDAARLKQKELFILMCKQG